MTVIERYTGRKFFKVVETKRLSKEQVSKVLDNKLAAGTSLFIDTLSSYKAYLKDHEAIFHKTVISKDHVSPNDKSVHVQNVNNIHSQVRDFMRPFRGVSSKYLQNYLNWYSYRSKIESYKHSIQQWFMAMLIYDSAYGIFELFKLNEMIIRT